MRHFDRNLFEFGPGGRRPPLVMNSVNRGVWSMLVARVASW
jgi:hypothetical protein